MSLLSMILLTTGPELLTGEAAATSTNLIPADPLAAFTIGILVFLIFIFLFLIVTLIQFKNAAFPSPEESSFKVLVQKLAGTTVAVEDEESIMTDHVYDGIRELDNDMPTWWKYLFYVTIVFSFVYIYYYHFTGTNKSQLAEYQQEMNVAEQEMLKFQKSEVNSIDETNVKLADAAGIEKGKVLFNDNCTACHGKVGEGGVGPNLTDEYWLHGGGLNNVFKTIKHGVPEKGMISWQKLMSPTDMQNLSSYVISLGGTNPPNAQAPKGEKYVAQ